ncbi:histamine H2 receptor-like isoform X1 [Acropora muricata]|uniref:histamine H2 receptor-like isoform X1 n=1 Tax=Acropora muricata TaxID=159855 RepID=UPI0034E4E7DA
METVSDALHLSTLFKAFQTTVLCVVFLANLLGNICVCLAVIRVSSLRRRPMASILASLALSDIASLSFTLFRLVWVYDMKAACMNYQYFFTILTTLLYISSIHICLLSCDRFVAIVHSLRYEELVTKERVRRALAFAWSVPLVATIAVPWIYYEGRVPFTAALVGCVKLEIEPSQAFKIHVACNFAFFVVIPFAVMIFVYSYIGKVARSQNERVWAGEHLTPEVAERERKRKKEMKWMRTIIIVIGTFAVCYFPTFISALPAPSLGPNHVPRALLSILSLLVTINGALNPVIYVLRSNEFKIAFKNFWRRARHMVISYIP